MSASMEAAPLLMQRTASLTDSAATARSRESAAYVGWVNRFLAQRAPPTGSRAPALRAANIEEDFADGVLLINVIEVAFDTSVGKWNATPRTLAHQLDNVQLSFDALRRNGVELVGVTPNDIAQRRLKQTIIVLWNTIRGVALYRLTGARGAGAGDRGAGAGSASAAGVRRTLLEWCQGKTQGVVESVAGGGSGAAAGAAGTGAALQITDFKSSFASGRAFVAIVNTLVPGKIDMAATANLTPAQNLELAQRIAEEHLGIPGLLSAEDIAAGELDEQSVMNYVCMLVSAAKSSQKTASSEQMKREVEVGRLRAEIEREQAAMEASRREFESLRTMHAAVLDTERGLRSEVDTTRATLEQERVGFEAHLSKLQAELTSLSEALRTARAEKAALEERAAEAARASQLELYQMHRENADLLQQLASAQHEVESAHQTGRDNARTAKRSGSVINDLGVRLVNESLHQLLGNMENRTGMLQKRRPGNVIFKNWKSRFFVLQADRLLYFEKKENKTPKGYIDLRYILPIGELPSSTSSEDVGGAGAGAGAGGAAGGGDESDSDDGAGGGGGAAGGTAASASMDRLASGPDEFVIYPNSLAKAAGQKLKRAAFKCPDGEEATREWIRAVNLRVAVLSYVHQLETKKKRGSREVVDFLCERASDLRTLRILDVVNEDLGLALEHFHTALGESSRLRQLIVRNCELRDSDVAQLARIVAVNHNVQEVDLGENGFSHVAATQLADAVKTNPALRVLRLDGNHVGDVGLRALAAALALRPTLETLSLCECDIGDEGAIALCEGVQRALATHGRHAFNALLLSRNRVGTRSMQAVAALLQRSATVTIVRLDSNNVDDEGVSLLAASLSSGQTKLAELYLGGNSISSRGASSLADALKATAGRGRVLVDLTGSRMIGRTGLTSLMSADFPLEFQALTIVRPQ